MDKTDNIFDRLEYVIEKEGLNISSFAKEIGVGDQTVERLVKPGKVKPGLMWFPK